MVEGNLVVMMREGEGEKDASWGFEWTRACLG